MSDIKEIKKDHEQEIPVNVLCPWCGINPSVAGSICPSCLEAVKKIDQGAPLNFNSF